jgi:hypothetical protein
MKATSVILLALLLNQHVGVIAEFSIPLGETVLGNHADIRRGLQGPTEPYIEDGGDTSGSADTISGTRSGRGALMKEQREPMKSRDVISTTLVREMEARL